jgi:hypothetical protein
MGMKVKASDIIAVQVGDKVWQVRRGTFDVDTELDIHVGLVAELDEFWCSFTNDADGGRVLMPVGRIDAIFEAMPENEATS